MTHPMINATHNDNGNYYNRSQKQIKNKLNKIGLKVNSNTNLGSGNASDSTD
jgi:hypothetical protein